MLRPLWKSYRDWLRLLVTFFDAANILLAYVVQTGFRPIAMRIVTVPQDPELDRKLLPWKEVLTNEKCFPTSALDGTSQDSKSNEAIISYIENSIRNAPSNPPLGHSVISPEITVRVLRKIFRRLAVNALKHQPKDLDQYPFANKSVAILELLLGGNVDADRLQKMKGNGKFPCITPTDTKKAEGNQQAASRIGRHHQLVQHYEQYKLTTSAGLYIARPVWQVSSPQMLYMAINPFFKSWR